MNLLVARDKQRPVREHSQILAVMHLPADADGAEGKIRADWAGRRMAHVLIFAADKTSLEHAQAAVREALPQVPVCGCTTAGQIGPQGYEDADTVLVGLPADTFAAQTVLIEDVSQIAPSDLIDGMIQKRIGMERAHPQFSNGFAFLMVDGMSRSEDTLAARLAQGMGAWPLFGGSAGDGTRFAETFVIHDGTVHRNAAVVVFALTCHAVDVFSLNHLTPTDVRMVVTEADPERRVVKELNAEPAAAEYARIIGKAPGQLDEFTFAAHPVVVRLGDTHHVRAIQRVNAAGELVFFSAIDEGMVLTVAEPQDIAAHMQAELARLTEGRGHCEILAADCILRRIEARQTQKATELSSVLREHRVVGFSSYGEQIGPIHVNQTMTGVVLSHDNSS